MCRRGHISGVVGRIRFYMFCVNYRHSLIYASNAGTLCTLLAATMCARQAEEARIPIISLKIEAANGGGRALTNFRRLYWQELGRQSWEHV